MLAILFGAGCLVNTALYEARKAEFAADDGMGGKARGSAGGTHGSTSVAFVGDVDGDGV